MFSFFDSAFLCMPIGHHTSWEPLIVSRTRALGKGGQATGDLHTLLGTCFPFCSGFLAAKTEGLSFTREPYSRVNDPRGS